METETQRAVATSSMRQMELVRKTNSKGKGVSRSGPKEAVGAR